MKGNKEGQVLQNDVGAIFRYGGQGRLLLFISIFWLRCVSVAAHKLSLVAGAGASLLLQCMVFCCGFSCCGAWTLECAGSEVVVLRLSLLCGMWDLLPD